jgi:epoxyqueuosine reductase QueG
MNEIRTELTDALKGRGAVLVGFADLGAVPGETRGGMPRGISIAVALDQLIILGIAGGPTREYEGEYRRANTLLAELGDTAAGILRSRGHRVAVNAPTAGRHTPDFRTPLPHKTVATRSGLGWIGKNALLITEKFGSAVRLNSVLTDAPFKADEPVDLSRCGNCLVCREVCPGKAPAGTNWELGRDRDEFFSAAACRQSAIEATGKAGLEIRTICGICIAACPWTQAYLKRASGIR